MANSAIDTVVLVLGMHRSGTSAIARTLNLLGFGIPKTLIKSNSTNEKGHWESRRVARLNDKILAAGDLTWSDWRQGTIGQIDAASREHFKSDIIQTLESEFEGHKKIVLKDPRISRLTPLYLDALDTMGAKVHPIIAFRNPLEVLSSLQKRNDIDPLDAVYLWLRYTLEAEEATRHMNRGFVHFETFLTDWSKVITRLIDSLAIECPITTEDAKPLIDAHLDGALKHHRYSAADTIHDERTEGWAASVFSALEVLQNNPLSELPLEKIIRTKREMDGANLALQTLSSLRAQQSQQILDRANEQIEELSAENQEAHQKQVRYLEKISERESELQSQEARISALNAALLGANAKIETLETSMTNANTASLQSKEEYNLLLSKMESREREMQSASFKIEQLVADLALARDELSAKMRDVDTITPRLKSREKELRQLKRQFWRLKDELAWQKDILNAVRASTSWKITTPLRRVKTALSKLKGSQPGLEPQKKIASDPDQNAEPIPIERPAPPPPGPAKHSVDQQIRRIEAADLFDEAYYMAHTPEAQTFKGTALEHYVRLGWRDGKDPSAEFVTKAWIAGHPELKTGDVCPLFDFLERNPNSNPKSKMQREVGRIAVFGAVANGYDDVKDPSKTASNVDYFLFTDGEVPSYSNWVKRDFEFVSSDPTRTARYLKTHPHLYFGEYDWAIWVDANLQIVCDPCDLIADLDESTQISTWLHPLRNCVYEEAKECLARGKDDAQSIEALVEHLRSERFPEQAGLFETSVFISKMGDEDVVNFMNDWWTLIDQFSRRDQLALQPTLRKHKLKLSALANQGVCMRTDPRFVYHRHSK